MYALHSNSRDSLIAKKQIAINVHIKAELAFGHRTAQFAWKTSERVERWLFGVTRDVIQRTKKQCILDGREFFRVPSFVCWQFAVG